ncbi:hypothetical protein [Streptomyces qinglanensis]|nr:hypothetical protein [Streptomyces qinglanensis]
MGHRSTITTEVVYRKQIRPVINKGAKAMDDVFADITKKDDPQPE